jgi:hypothetical protein
MKINNFNILCAEFLFPSLVCIDETGIWGIDRNLSKYKIPDILKNHYSNVFVEEELKFDKDWNWVFYLKSKVCELDIVDEFNVNYCSVQKGYFGSIFPAYKNSFDSIYSKIYKNEIDVYINLIGELLTYIKNQTT